MVVRFEVMDRNWKVGKERKRLSSGLPLYFLLSVFPKIEPSRVKEPESKRVIGVSIKRRKQDKENEDKRSSRAHTSTQYLKVDAWESREKQ